MSRPNRIVLYNGPGVSQYLLKLTRETLLNPELRDRFQGSDAYDVTINPGANYEGITGSTKSTPKLFSLIGGGSALEIAQNMHSSFISHVIEPAAGTIGICAGAILQTTVQNYTYPSHFNMQTNGNPPLNFCQLLNPTLADTLPQILSAPGMIKYNSAVFTLDQLYCKEIGLKPVHVLPKYTPSELAQLNKNFRLCTSGIYLDPIARKGHQTKVMFDALPILDCKGLRAYQIFISGVLWNIPDSYLRQVDILGSLNHHLQPDYSSTPTFAFVHKSTNSLLIGGHPETAINLDGIQETCSTDAFCDGPGIGHLYSSPGFEANRLKTSEQSANIFYGGLANLFSRAHSQPKKLVKPEPVVVSNTGGGAAAAKITGSR